MYRRKKLKKTFETIFAIFIFSYLTIVYKEVRFGGFFSGREPGGGVGEELRERKREFAPPQHAFSVGLCYLTTDQCFAYRNYRRKTYRMYYES